MRWRYGRWTGTQQPFPIDVSADDVLSELSEDLLSGYDPSEALARLLERGMPGGRMSGRVAGLSALRERVEEARRREAARLGLEGPLREAEQRLEAILDRERLALAYDARPEVDDREAQLDALPADLAARLRALEDYPSPGSAGQGWTDPSAGRDFRALVDDLRRQVAEATFGRLAGALGQMTPADVERVRDFLADLNRLIDAKARGEDTTEGFAQLRERYPDLVPDGVDDLDDLLAELARRMAAMSSLMAGLDPDQRAQLAQLASDLLGDLDLSFEASQLARSLQAMFPHLAWDAAPASAQPTGAEQGSLRDTIDWMERLQEQEDLAAALRQDYAGARLEDVDEDALRRALGEDAVDDLRALREIERLLEEAGAATRSGGRLELTPRGVRRLGERSLAQIYARAVSGAVGSHRALSAGGEGELTGATRQWRFGDPFRLDVGRTVGNAIMRRASASDPGLARDELAPHGRAVRLAPDDFELAEAERRVRAATVLLLDMSFSMPLRGNWVPAKRVALALQSLISSQFPEDRFWIVGFSDYARQLQPRDLFAIGWERVYGTNMQHAFRIARRLLGTQPAAEQQVIMITDGEPTAHLEGDQALFSWPPEPRTLQLTLQEAARLSRTGATMNVFLLDHDPGAARFVERMVSSYGGRIFYPDLDDLGSLVVRDFLHRRPSSRRP